MSETTLPPEEPDKSLDTDTAEMNASELAEAKRYGRQGLVCDLADRALDVAFLAAAAMLLARPVDTWLAGWPLLEGSWTLRLVALYLIVLGLHVCVSFPLSYYSGHVLEHRYKLSTLSFSGWLWRYAKRIGLGGLFNLAIYVGLFWLIWTTGAYWWLWAAAASFVVMVVIGQLTPVLIIPLFYKTERLDHSELDDRMARLAEGTGLSIEGVYRMALSEETVKANAMLAGLGRTRRVLLSDTLLERFEPEEIEVIFAHEIGHHVFRHIRKMIVLGIVYCAAGLWLCDRLIDAWVIHSEGHFDYATLPVYTLPMLTLILTLFAMLIEPIQNVISRAFERQCDAYALERTGSTEAYRSAFQKLAKLNKDDPDPHPLEVFLFHGHPPIAQRLAMADREPPADEDSGGT